jgi:hypothetical protein
MSKKSRKRPRSRTRAGGPAWPLDKQWPLIAVWGYQHAHDARQAGTAGPRLPCGCVAVDLPPAPPNRKAKR